MSVTTITPYLFFRGRCEEAIAFYREALGAEVQFMMRHNESPEPPPPGMLQPGFENKVMHASAIVGGAPLMMSDGCDDKGTPGGFKLALSFQTEDRARHAFEALARSGNVEMPMTKTFWSPCFGMVTDQFGVEWMVTVAAPPQ